jgi:transcriptional regulator of acetoin/glycerol metabolism
MSIKIIVVDDQYATDTNHQSKFLALCSEVGIEPTFCSAQTSQNGRITNDVTSAVKAAQASESQWALALVDMHFISGDIGAEGVAEGEYGDEKFGLQVEAAFRQAFPNLSIVRFTDLSESQISEPSSAPYLSKRKVTSADIGRCVVRHGSLGANDRRKLLSIPASTVFESRAMFSVYAEAQTAAMSQQNVLILGESGTGKEHLARYIHRQSTNSNGPFVTLNMAAISKDLIESELFGHEKGSFTGAQGKKHGLVHTANNGVLFLDEIGDFPADSQAKLLRLLQEKEYFLVGGTPSSTRSAVSD